MRLLVGHPNYCLCVAYSLIASDPGQQPIPTFLSRRVSLSSICLKVLLFSLLQTIGLDGRFVVCI